MTYQVQNELHSIKSTALKTTYFIIQLIFIFQSKQILHSHAHFLLIDVRRRRRDEVNNQPSIWTQAHAQLYRS